MKNVEKQHKAVYKISFGDNFKLHSLPFKRCGHARFLLHKAGGNCKDVQSHGENNHTPAKQTPMTGVVLVCFLTLVYPKCNKIKTIYSHHIL